MTQTIPTFSLDFEATKVSKYFVSGDHLEGIVRDQLRNEGAGRNHAMGNVRMIRDHENVCVPGLGIVTLEENPDLENVDGRGLWSVSGLDQETAMIEYDHDPRLLQGEELETEDTTDRLLDEGSHFSYISSVHLLLIHPCESQLVFSFNGFRISCCQDIPYRCNTGGINHYSLSLLNMK